MLANPPYGKSWKSDLERMGGKKDIKDPRFIIEHAGESDYSLLNRSSDGHLLFLVNMLSKMKQDTPLGCRIGEVHNGSSLFTGDAGLVETATKLRDAIGDELFENHNIFLDAMETALKKLGLKLSAADRILIVSAVSWRDETAPPVIAKLLKEEPDALRGRYPISLLGQSPIANRKSPIVNPKRQL